MVSLARVCVLDSVRIDVGFVVGSLSAAIFERRRYFNVPVQWARHPDLREYIHSAVSNLQTWIQQVRMFNLLV